MGPKGQLDECPPLARGWIARPAGRGVGADCLLKGKVEMKRETRRCETRRFIALHAIARVLLSHGGVVLFYGLSRLGREVFDDVAHAGVLDEVRGL